MTGDTIHIHNAGGTVYIGGELGESVEASLSVAQVDVPVIPEGTPEGELMRSENPGAMADIGYDVHPDAHIETPEAPTDEERVEVLEAKMEELEAQEDASIIRKGYLEDLVVKVDNIRNAEGQLRNPYKQPKNRSWAEKKLATNTKHAKDTLANACGSCALSGDCKLEGKLDRWIATHPYKDVATDKSRAASRPGSLPEVKTEARVSLLKALSEREPGEPEVHCDPNRRTPKPAPLEQSSK